MVEMLHSPTFIPDKPDQEHDPENVRCTPHMWRIFTKTAPERYASTFAAMYGRGGRRPLIDDLVNRLQDFELHLNPLQACVSAITRIRDADGSMVDEDQNSQNPPVEELINLVSS